MYELMFHLNQAPGFSYWLKQIKITIILYENHNIL